jgi:hypothetical protein
MLRLLLLAFVLSGCSVLNPDLVRELAKDDASICIYGDIRGGAGAVAGVPTGGYGQGTVRLCRSNQPNAIITMGPDGSISITHDDTP